MAKDFILEDGDLQIKNGDFVIGESDNQHIEHLLVANPGEYTQHPVLGVGIKSYLKAPMSQRLRNKMEKDILVQLEYDGANNTEVEYTREGNLKIEATYAD